MPELGVRLRPSEVRYSQDSVAGTFTDGRRIETTFRDLLKGIITVDAIPAIEVVQDDYGVYWALTGNRRLVIFKRLESLGIVSKIPVDIQSASDNASRFRERMTTVSEGRDISVRQTIAVRQMDRIEEEWRRATGRPAMKVLEAPPPVVHHQVLDNMSALSLLETRPKDETSTARLTSLNRYRQMANVVREPERELELEKSKNTVERRSVFSLREKTDQKMELADGQLKMRQFLEQYKSETRDRLAAKERQRQNEERLAEENLQRLMEERIVAQRRQRLAEKQRIEKLREAEERRAAVEIQRQTDERIAAQRSQRQHLEQLAAEQRQRTLYQNAAVYNAQRREVPVVRYGRQVSVLKSDGPDQYYVGGPGKPILITRQYGG